MEEPKPIIPAEVDNSEFVDRIAYEPSFFCEGRLAPSAFALTLKGEAYISVFRNSYYSFADIDLPKARTEGDTVAGIAQLLVKEIRSIPSPTPESTVSVTVEATSSPKYPFHAGIFISIDGIPIKGGMQHTTPWLMYVQKELVERATFIPISKLLMHKTQEEGSQ